MTQGFTVEQVANFRRKMPTVGVDEDFLKCAQASSGLVSALAGAGIGAGLGLATDAIRPVDEDEDRVKRRLSSLLAGATLGGLAGYGLNRTAKAVPWISPKRPGFWSRALEAVDPDISTTIAAGGLGIGLAPAFSRGGTVYGMFTPGARELSGLPLDSKFFDNNPDIAGALKSYTAMTGGGKRVVMAKVLQRLGVKDKFNPWANRLALSNAMAGKLESVLNNSTNFGTLLTRAGIDGSVNGIPKVNPTAAGFAHNAARNLKVPGKHSRALRALAILAGLGGLAYKHYDMTH